MSAAPAPGSWRGWLHLGLVVIGVATIVYGAFFMARMPVTCRGEQMHPGELCHRNTYTELNSAETQSFEQRRQAMMQSRPTIIASGVVLAGFGLILHRRQSASRPAVSPDEERLLATR